MFLDSRPDFVSRTGLQTARIGWPGDPRPLGSRTPSTPKRPRRFTHLGTDGLKPYTGHDDTSCLLTRIRYLSYEGAPLQRGALDVCLVR
jgi:hypothetical protein